MKRVEIRVQGFGYSILNTQPWTAGESALAMHAKHSENLPWGGDFPEEAAQFFSPCFLWTRPSQDETVRPPPYLCCGDTPPCKVTPVILHRVVSPDVLPPPWELFPCARTPHVCSLLQPLLVCGLSRCAPPCVHCPRGPLLAPPASPFVWTREAVRAPLCGHCSLEHQLYRPPRESRESSVFSSQHACLPWEPPVSG